MDMWWLVVDLSVVVVRYDNAAKTQQPAENRTVGIAVSGHRHRHLMPRSLPSLTPPTIYTSRLAARQQQGRGRHISTVRVSLLDRMTLLQRLLATRIDICGVEIHGTSSVGICERRPVASDHKLQQPAKKHDKKLSDSGVKPQRHSAVLYILH